MEDPGAFEVIPSARRPASLFYSDAPEVPLNRPSGPRRRRPCLRQTQVPLRACLLTLPGLSFPRLYGFWQSVRCRVSSMRRLSDRSCLRRWRSDAEIQAAVRISSQEEMFFSLWLATGEVLLLWFTATQARTCRRWKKEKEETKVDLNSFYKTLKPKIIQRVGLDLIVFAAHL